LRLDRELGRDCVGGQAGDRWTSVSTRDSFPLTLCHLLSTDCSWDPVSTGMLKYASEKAYAVSETYFTLHKMVLEHKLRKEQV